MSDAFAPPEQFQPRSSPLLEPEPRGPRLVLHPEPPRDHAASARPAFDSLAGYVAADDRQRTARRIATAVLLLALAAGGWLFFSRGYSAWRQPGNSARDGIASLADRPPLPSHASATRPVPGLTRLATHGKASPPRLPPRAVNRHRTPPSLQRSYKPRAPPIAIQPPARVLQPRRIP